jgi:hypothetical protein
MIEGKKGRKKKQFNHLCQVVCINNKASKKKKKYSGEEE